jgi:hypothetical protein
MSWSELASNQMVTFTNAQTSPFTLNAGQSAVTSNECMTKSQALTKYNLNASAMSAYANNQLVPKSVWQSAVSGLIFSVALGNSAAEACGSTFADVYSNTDIWDTGITLYTDINLTTPVTGFTRVVYEGDYFSLNSTTGVVGSVVGAC